MRLSIIIPAHNEEARIGRMLDAYLPFYADRYGNQVELIIVVNGSTDDTSGVVEGYVARYAQLRCIVDPNRIGKGGALLRGFREARGDLIGFVDADGSTPPAAFQDLVDRLGDADVAVASRWCDGASVSPRQPLARRIASRVFNLLTRVLFGLRLTDTQCGAKLMRRDALIPILGYLGITRWAFDVDLLFQLHRSGRTIVEIPTTWQDVAGSKVDILSVSAEMLAAVARLRLVYSPLRWVVGVYDSLIGPVIHPDGLERDHLFGHSAVLLACAQLTHLGNLLFQGSMMRMLDDTQYGILAAMLGVFAAVTMPLSALPWAMAHFTARAIRDGRPREARALLSAVTRDVAIAGAVGLAIAFFSADAIARSFKLEGELPLLLTAAAVVVSLGGSTALGAIQGAQRFVWMAGSAIAWSFSRFFFAAAFVALGGAATGALLGHTASMIVSALLAVMGMRRVFGSVRERPERTPGFYR
ncbi:MAG: glycosyltransferase [Planctomycetia bacterium]